MTYHFRQLSSESAKRVQSLLMRNASLTKAFVLGLSASIAYSLPLPTAAVKDVDDHYRHDLWNTVNGLINKINEMLPHDLNQSGRLVQDLYAYRYSQAFPNKYFVATKPGCGVVDFFRISSRLSEEWLEILDKNPADVMLYAKDATCFLEDFQAHDVALAAHQKGLAA